MATFAIEVRADKPNFKTEWTFHKSRFIDVQGQQVITGWKRGRYVEYDDKFKLEVLDMKNKRAIAQDKARNGVK